MRAGAATTEEATLGLRRGAPTEARERRVGAKLGATTARAASEAASRPRVDTGEEQEEVREVNDELTVATQERTGATLEPRMSSRMRVDERRVGVRRERSTA